MASFGAVYIEHIAMPNNRITPCKCGFLEQHANEPDSPIRFDPKLNEYHFIYLTSTGEATMMIYYCPICGGRAPKSRRANLFCRLTHSERRRLTELTKNMRTVQDVITTLGEPDIRHLISEVITTPERDGKPEITKSYP